MVSQMNHLRASSRINYLVSALNTNFLVRLSGGHNNGFALFRKKIFIHNALNVSTTSETLDCGISNPRVASGFINASSLCEYQTCHREVYVPARYLELVDGFCTACTPLEAILASNLDCLRRDSCIRSLTKRFPSFQQVRIELSFVICRGAPLGSLQLDILGIIFSKADHVRERFVHRSFHRELVDNNQLRKVFCGLRTFVLHLLYSCSNQYFLCINLIHQSLRWSHHDPPSTCTNTSQASNVTEATSSETNCC